MNKMDLIVDALEDAVHNVAGDNTEAKCIEALAAARELHGVNKELVEALNKILWTRTPNRNPSRYAHTVEEIAFKVLAKHDKARGME
jgi:hypothetical protein